MKDNNIPDDQIKGTMALLDARAKAEGLSTDDFIQVAFRIGEEIEVVKKAQEENRQKGLPSVYSKNKNLLRTS